MKIKLDTIHRIVRTVILHYGYSKAETEAILEVLMYAQMRGNNQGLVKLIGVGIPKPSGLQPFKVIRETRNSVLLDARQNHPMIIVTHAARLTASKAKAHGLAVAGINGVNASSGALGFYARLIAQQDLVGFVFASAPGSVAPAGSYEPVLGTNPMAIAVPGKTDPFVLDMATSVMARFGVVEAKTTGRPLPKGVAYTNTGEPTTDPVQALDGALRTFDGGYKSTALSMMIQILAGPLVGSAFMEKGNVKLNCAGHLLLAVDPELLGGIQTLRQGVETILKSVKVARKLPGIDEIFIAGERGDRCMAAVLASGEIEIEDNLLAELKLLARSGS